VETKYKLVLSTSRVDSRKLEFAGYKQRHPELHRHGVASLFQQDDWMSKQNKNLNEQDLDKESRKVKAVILGFGFLEYDPRHFSPRDSVSTLPSPLPQIGMQAHLLWLEATHDHATAVGMARSAPQCCGL
jgi:hypothetical protein